MDQCLAMLSRSRQIDKELAMEYAKDKDFIRKRIRSVDRLCQLISIQPLSRGGVKVSGIVEGFDQFDAVDRIKRDAILF